MSAAGILRRWGPEAQECGAYCDWFQRRYPDLWPELAHIANERKSKLEAIALAAMGVRPGVSDYLLTAPRGGFIGMWLEFKTRGATWSKVTQAQRDWLFLMGNRGYFASVAYGVDHAIEITEAYVSEAVEPRHWPGPGRGAPK